MPAVMQRAPSAGDDNAPSSATADHRTYLPLASVVAVGAALRLYGLDHQSLWNDEMASVVGAARASTLDALRYVPPDHLQGYQFLLHVWTRCFGDSETVLRLLSALLGIATIPAMFVLGRRCYGDPEALLAAGLTAVAWMPVYYSQEARPYALLLLCVVLSLICLADVLRALHSGSEPSRGAVIGYIAAAGATASTHYFGLLAVVVQAAIVGAVLAGRPRALARAAALNGIVLVACIPALLMFFYRARPPGWLMPPTLDTVWDLLVRILHHSETLAWLVIALWGGCALRAALARRDRIAPATWLLLAWLVLPVAIAYLYSVLVAPVFLHRALIIVVPAVYLLVARAVTQLPLRPAGIAAVSAGLLGLMLFDLVITKAYFIKPVKGQVREATAFLVAHDAPEAPALVLACAHNAIEFNYYLERLGSARRVDQLVSKEADANVVRRLIDERRPQHVWILDGHKPLEPALLDALAADLTLIETAQFLESAAWHFRPSSHAENGAETAESPRPIVHSP
jgi:hypothetical protein